MRHGPNARAEAAGRGENAMWSCEIRARTRLKTLRDHCLLAFTLGTQHSMVQDFVHPQYGCDL